MESTFRAGQRPSLSSSLSAFLFHVSLPLSRVLFLLCRAFLFSLVSVKLCSSGPVHREGPVNTAGPGSSSSQKTTLWMPRAHMRVRSVRATRHRRSRRLWLRCEWRSPARGVELSTPRGLNILIRDGFESYVEGYVHERHEHNSRPERKFRATVNPLPFLPS